MEVAIIQFYLKNNLGVQKKLVMASVFAISGFIGITNLYVKSLGYKISGVQNHETFLPLMDKIII